MMYVRFRTAHEFMSWDIADRERPSRIFLLRNPPVPVEADQVLPEPKQFITAEQLEEIWTARGLKYRVDDFHVNLLSRGLTVAVNREMFRSAVFELLESFLVKGAAKLPANKTAIPRFPKVA